MIKVLQIKFTRVQHSRVKTLQDNRAKHCKKQPNCHCNTWETIPSSTCNTWETIPSRRAAVEHIAAATTRLCVTCLFSLFLVKARAGATPQRGPRKDGLSPKRGLPGYHYWKRQPHRAERRATWRATSPTPGRTAAKLNEIKSSGNIH